MTYREYKNWAREYLRQAKVLEGKIEKRRKISYFPSAKERENNEKLIQSMYQMRRECLQTYRLLDDRAEQIKEAEEREKQSASKRAS